MESHHLEIDGELRVVTDNSVWLVRAATYCRMPRREEPRYVPGPELADGCWHPHVGAWLVTDALGFRLRLLPPDRADSGHGIATGIIIASTPSLAALPPSAQVPEEDNATCARHPGPRPDRQAPKVTSAALLESHPPAHLHASPPPAYEGR